MKQNSPDFVVTWPTCRGTLSQAGLGGFVPYNATRIVHGAVLVELDDLGHPLLGDVDLQGQRHPADGDADAALAALLTGAGDASIAGAAVEGQQQVLLKSGLRRDPEMVRNMHLKRKL